MSDIDKDSEIDLSELVKKLWVKKRFILKWSLLGLVIGTIIAFSIPKEYTATIIFTTDSKKSINSNMGALASMAGINLSSSLDEDVFSPELYPEVIGSTPFLQNLLNINIVDKEQKINKTLYSYLEEDQKSAWWNYILKLPGILSGLFSSNTESENNNTTIKNDKFIPQKEMNIIKLLKESYSINTDKKTGVSIIEVTMQDPAIVAFMADTLMSSLQKYIIDKRTQKARTDLENTEKLFFKAKNEYHITQQTLATFMDKNMNVVSSRFRVNQENLQNEVSIAYSVYNQMAQQVQMNKIKVQDETPVFNVIQPAIEPLYPEKPKKKIIILACGFIGFISSCFWILGKNQLLLKK